MLVTSRRAEDPRAQGGGSSTTITATNSPGLTVASGAPSSRVTFQIPLKPNAQGWAVVSMTPGSQDQGFSWYGTDVFAA